MKIKELIEHLKEYDENLEVYISKDSEGNGFGRCSGISDYLTESDTGQYQFDDIYEEKDLISEGCELSDFRKVLVIWQ